MADINVEIAASLGRFEREMARVESRLTKLANSVEKKASSQLGRVDASAAQTAANLNRMVQSADKAGAAGRKFGGSLQQVGFQVGDFATQVGAGTSATQALGQQLPQLLGAFGTFGALAGAAAAVMIPLGSALLKTALDSETLEERMKALEASTDAMQEAAKLAATPISELRDKYGDLADEVARANGAMSAFTAAQANKDIGGAAKQTSKELFGGSFVYGRPGVTESEEATLAAVHFSKLARQIGGTVEEAKLLDAAMRDLERAKGPEAIYEAAERLLGVMSKLPDATEKLAPQYQAIDGLMQQALKQMEAQRSEVVRLREEYDATTGKLRALAADLSQAEAERAKSLAAGKTEEVAQWDRVIAKIREMVYETRAAAGETDTLFERMGKAAQGFMSRAGGFMEGAAGRMVGSTAISVGKQYAGMKERPNREELKALVGVDPATVAWCAAFMNAVLEKSGSKGTGSLSARSFLNWGTAVDQPGYGDVVVLKRGSSSAAGHVGFYEGTNPDGTIRVFGGNQSDGVRTSNFSRSDVLGYRRAPAPDRYVDPEAAADAERIAIAGERAAEAEKEQKRLADESAASLKREVAERERKAEAMQKAREALSADLISQQKAAELDRQRAEAIGAINASGRSDAEKAAAIAQVNAEMERQVTIMALMEEAKRRDVKLDEQMLNSTMTYRQAIEALADAKAAQVIADQEATAAADRLKEAQDFAAQQTQALKDGLVDAIVEGENFSDVLAGVAKSLAKAALQAALFGEGPMASLFGGKSTGGGLLGGLFSGLFGGARANGGPVTGGMPYLVGERGPEIIVPRSAGQVIPNHALGGSTFAPSNTIVINGDASERTVALIRQELAANNRQMERLMPAKVNAVNRDPLRRG